VCVFVCVCVCVFVCVCVCVCVRVVGVSALTILSSKSSCPTLLQQVCV